MATRTEIAKRIRELAPDIPDDKLKIAVDYFVANPEKYNPKKLILPFEAMTQVEAGVTGTGKAAVAAVVGGAKALGKLAKTAVPRTAEGTVSKKKLAKRAAGLGAAGWVVSTFGGGEDTVPDDATAQAMADQNLLMTAAQYQAQGGDINALVNTPAGQQLFAQGNIDLKALGLSGGKLPMVTGVYTGETVQTGLGPKGRPKYGLKTLSIADWKAQFPIGDPQKLQEWKSRLVNSGVVTADAGLGELQKQWEAWGQASMDMGRQGKNLTPYQLLDIQRGLWGGGGGGGPSYSVNLMKKENAVALFKQAMEAYTGRIVTDEEAASFAKSVESKQLAAPTKTETKTVKGKKVTVTTPGFGEVEAAKLAEKQAMKDPLYSQYQDANVFGTALEKALGIRG